MFTSCVPVGVRARMPCASGIREASHPPFARVYAQEHWGHSLANMSLRSILEMLGLAVIWGVSIPLTKLALEGMPPLALTGLRFAIAVPAFFLFLGFRSIPWPAMPRLAALGVLGIGVGQIAQTLGIEGTSASVGTTISATIPIFVVLFAALRLKQSVTAWQLFGLAAAFAGIALVASGQQGGAEGPATTWTGVGWVLLSAVTIAFYYVWSVELTNRYGAVVVAAWSTLFGFFSLVPLVAAEAARTPVNFSAQPVAIAAYLGLLVTVLGLYLWIHILRTVPARIAAGVQYLQPVVGIVLAAMMFGDHLGVRFAAGVALIFAGLALTLREKRPQQTRS